MYRHMKESGSRRGVISQSISSNNFRIGQAIEHDGHQTMQRNALNSSEMVETGPLDAITTPIIAVAKTIKLPKYLFHCMIRHREIWCPQSPPFLAKEAYIVPLTLAPASRFSSVMSA